MKKKERKSHLALEVVLLKIRDLIDDYLKEYYQEISEKGLHAEGVIFRTTPDVPSYYDTIQGIQNGKRETS